jgi:cell division protein ZapA (FtsZ GTPase activity inhibitor)
VEPDGGAKQQVKVTILNQSFTLLTQGDPQEMMELAQQVDDLMSSIARRSPNLDSARVAVFACLQLADQLRSKPTISGERLDQCHELLDQMLASS